MAGGSSLPILVSLQQNPLGTDKGENFGPDAVPNNYRIPPARIYVINHSRKRKWRRLEEPVSFRRGAEVRLMNDAKFRALYGNEDLVYRAVAQGRDMNQYSELDEKPVLYRLDLPGGKEILIPPSHPNTPDKHIMVEVPDGTWDMYLGNWERMQGYPGVLGRNADGTSQERMDPKVKSAEELLLSIRWKTRRNPVFRVTDDGKSEDRKNDFGILEFVRIPVRATKEIVDKDYLSALDLFEA